MVARIPLTCGKTALVDDEDYERLAGFKWYALRAISSRENWYAAKKEDGKNCYMHRFILSASEGQRVDHRDGDGLINTRSNLRFCTHQLNMANSRLPLPPSGYRGVRWKSDRSKWVAEAQSDGKSITIGGFHCAIEAARARDAYVKKLYGEFAVLNFV
jgi:hypothetical protein